MLVGGRTDKYAFLYLEYGCGQAVVVHGLIDRPTEQVSPTTIASSNTTTLHPPARGLVYLTVCDAQIGGWGLEVWWSDCIQMNVYILSIGPNRRSLCAT